MVLLTRSEIINGKAERKDVYIKALKKEISLRPLTDGEYNHIQAVEKDIGKIKANVDMTRDGDISLDEARKDAEQKMRRRGAELNLDLKKQEEKKFYAQCLTAAHGLSNDQETFTPDDMRMMRPVGAVQEIAEAVVRISKLEEPENLAEDTKNFPEVEPGLSD